MINSQIVAQETKLKIPEVKRGDIFYARLTEYKRGESSIQGGLRPFIILQNDIGNKYSPTVFGIPATSQLKRIMPTHAQLGEVEGLNKVTYCIAEQATTIDKRQLVKKVSNVTDEEMDKIEKCLMIEAGIDINKHIEKEVQRRLENNINRNPYSIHERTQNSAFDIYKVKTISSRINSLEDTIIKYSLNEETVSGILGDINSQFLELKHYCDQFKQDYRLFYKSKFQNDNKERVRKCV